MTLRALTVAIGLIGLALPCAAQEPAQPNAPAPQDRAAESQVPRPIQNAPDPRAFTLASYVYAASNVCGYKIGTGEFETLLARYGLKGADVAPRGRFVARLSTMFTMMSNDMQRNREQACLAVAAEYGPDGTIAKNVLQPMDGVIPEDGKGADGTPAPAEPAN